MVFPEKLGVAAGTAALIISYDNDEKVASSKKHTQFKTQGLGFWVRVRKNGGGGGSLQPAF